MKTRATLLLCILWSCACASPQPNPPPDETVTLPAPLSAEASSRSEEPLPRVAVNEPRVETPPSDPTTRSLCLGDCQRESASCDKRAGNDAGQLRICGSRLISCRERCQSAR